MAYRSGRSLDSCEHSSICGKESDHLDFGGLLNRNGDRGINARFAGLSLTDGPGTSCFYCERRLNECCQCCHGRRQNRESDDLAFRDAGVVHRASARSSQHRRLERCKFCTKVLTAVDLECDLIPGCCGSRSQSSDSDRHYDRSPMTTRLRNFQGCIPHVDGRLRKISCLAHDLCDEGMTCNGDFEPRGCSTREWETDRYLATSRRNSHNYDEEIVGSRCRAMPQGTMRNVINDCNCSCSFCVESKASANDAPFYQLGYFKEPPISSRNRNSGFHNANNYVGYSEMPGYYRQDNSYIPPDYKQRQSPSTSDRLLSSFHRISRFHDRSTVPKFDRRGDCGSTNSDTSDDGPVHEGLPISAAMNQEQERSLAPCQKVDNDDEPENECSPMKSQIPLDFKHTKRVSGRTSPIPSDRTKIEVVSSSGKCGQSRNKPRENINSYIPPSSSDHHCNRLPQARQHQISRFYHRSSTYRNDTSVDSRSAGSNISDAEAKFQEGLSISASSNQEQEKNIVQRSPTESQMPPNCRLGKKRVSGRTCAASNNCKQRRAVSSSTNQGPERNIAHQRQEVDDEPPEKRSTSDFKCPKRPSERIRSSNEVIRRRLERYKNSMVDQGVFRASDHVLKELKKVLEERGRWNGN